MTPVLGVGPLFCRSRSASVGGDKIKGIPKRRQVSEGVLRSQHRVYDGAGRPRHTMATTLASRFWWLGCHKIFHEAVARLNKPPALPGVI
ncbi:MAG: hypothetical protein KAI44_05150 [Methylococcales bacterium]|nr:hypothetical protein [Methylococcales bacterium]